MFHNKKFAAGMLAAILTVAAGTQSVVMAQEITPDASSMSIPFSTVITLKSDGQPEPKVPVPIQNLPSGLRVHSAPPCRKT